MNQVYTTSTYIWDDINKNELSIDLDDFLDELEERFFNNKSWSVPKACRNCPNHPSNGGNGICNCILGNPTISISC